MCCCVPVVVAVDGVDERFELLRILCFLTKVDHIDCNIVLLKTFSKSDEFILIRTQWASYKCHDALMLVLVLSVFQSQLKKTVQMSAMEVQGVQVHT